MKRDILTLSRNVTTCCPGHDTYPNEKYSSRRSTRARARDIKREHQHARSILKRATYRAAMEALLEPNED